MPLTNAEGPAVGKVESLAGAAPATISDPGYWHELIDEKRAAEFLGLTDRTMQAYRQQGGGPKYIRVSARCIRYRRIDLHEWAEARVRASTSDPGSEADTA